MADNFLTTLVDVKHDDYINNSGVNHDMKGTNDNTENYTDEEITDLHLNVDLKEESADENLKFDERCSSPDSLLAYLKKEGKGREFELSRSNAIKCLALSKIIFGEIHEEVAESHIYLSEIYLEARHYSQQALKHTELARGILLDIKEEKQLKEPQFMIQRIYYIMGRANLQMNKLKVAENCLLKAKVAAENTKIALKKYIEMKIMIYSSLARVLSKLGNYGQAIEIIEIAQEITDKMDEKQELTELNLYKQIVEIELMNKDFVNVSSACTACSQALKISILLYGKNTKETAEILTAEVLLELRKENPNYENACNILNEIKEIYNIVEDKQNWINTEQILCKLYLQQKKLSEASNSIVKCIEECEILKGDMSLKSAELYELKASILYSQSKLKQAIFFYNKAEEIYRGKKKYKGKQEKITKLVEMIRKGNKDEKFKTNNDKLKDRPRFA